MKLLYAIAAMMATTASVNAFLPAFRPQRSPATMQPQRPALMKPCRMTAEVDSDFPSAMPDKPAETLMDRMVSSATSYIVHLESTLGEGVDPPPELEALKKARDDGSDPSVIAARLYEVMIERGMTYDEDEQGILTPTEFVIKDQLDVPEVKDEFDQLYKYGIGLMQRGLIDVEEVQEIVKERLIARTGMEPEEFDKWLGYGTDE